MGFILLAGITLMMGLFAKVKPLKDASKGLVGLRVPIGIVAFFSGLAAFRGGARFVWYTGCCCGDHRYVHVGMTIPLRRWDCIRICNLFVYRYESVPQTSRS